MRIEIYEGDSPDNQGIKYLVSDGSIEETITAAKRHFKVKEVFSGVCYAKSLDDDQIYFDREKETKPFFFARR